VWDVRLKEDENGDADDDEVEKVDEGEKDEEAEEVLKATVGSIKASDRKQSQNETKRHSSMRSERFRSRAAAEALFCSGVSC